MVSYLIYNPHMTDTYVISNALDNERRSCNVTADRDAVITSSQYPR